MMDFSDVPIYLHRAPVDFRKAINGLSIIVDNESMGSESLILVK
jgi:transposase